MLSFLWLFLAAYGAAAISGAAGFGGALLLLPLLVATVGTTEAVPLLTIAQFIGNLSRAGFGFSQIQWRPAGLFLLGAIPFSILGSVSFVALPKDTVNRGIGTAILLFILLKSLGTLKWKASPTFLILGGGSVGFLSGLVGSAGPLGAAIFLTLGLPPVAYVATEAATALAMHGAKTAVYQYYIPLDGEFWRLAGFMGLAMVLGTWSAKKVIERLPRDRFQQYVAGLLAVMAVYMVAHG
ncbi:sulfite exporter TauE/SafE family protein [Methylocaldum sp.]|uniref:sulfite exporter TauE/SafE family protein n=1 Tax=Methylocaldum sp. TaxID=1969727 RepID=UPI002D5FAED6|nr:sulfite exporter TauE/SafE family protein [Methylocaldum sp.]HYE34664.1 sulfite exporter TauE/SafE family protein [Methylocaldum sp.]